MAFVSNIILDNVVALEKNACPNSFYDVLIEDRRPAGLYAACLL